MKIYDEKKENEIAEVDYSKYKLGSFKRLLKHHDAILRQEEKTHYETIKEYPNGSKDVRKVVDQPKIKPKDAWDEYEECAYIIPLTDEEKKARLRTKRENLCFSILDRSKFWYDTLTAEETKELKEWYEKWLNVTETMVEPETPKWLKSEVK